MPTCERRPQERHEAALERSASALRSHRARRAPSHLQVRRRASRRVRGTGFTGKQNFEKRSFVPARSTASPDGPSLRHNVRALPRCSRASTLRMQRSRGFEVRTPNCEPKLSGSSGSAECAGDVASMTCNQRRTRIPVIPDTCSD